MGVEAIDPLDGPSKRSETAKAALTRAVLEAIAQVVAGDEPPAEHVSSEAKDTNRAAGPIEITFELAKPMRHPRANVRQARRHTTSLGAHERRVVQQATKSVARFFLGMDVEYENYQKAKQLRTEAAKGLDTQRAYYEEGRITIDRFLEAASQCAALEVIEHQYLTTYNITLAALSEAKGTLLADRNIVLAEGPRPTTSPQFAQTKRDDQTETASFEPAKREPAGGNLGQIQARYLDLLDLGRRCGPSADQRQALALRAARRGKN